MPRLKLTIAYVGTQYHGWQTQARKNASPLPTIQNIIEDAVAHVLGERVHVHGAGRTDAGVHAEAQVAHLDVPESRARMDWQLALNTLLPRDIRIADAVLVPDTFHAQHSAVRKTYEYRLWLSKRYTPPQLFPFVWACGPVDVERMDEGSRYLLGKRDFASLKNAGTNLRTTVRTILSITRTTVGLLVAVGQGKLEPADIPGILDACDRRMAPLTAPACGLTMKKVWYDDMFPLAASGHEGA